MTRAHPRRGTSLIELLVVLVLLLPVLSIGAIATRRVLTTEAALGTRAGRAAAISDALQAIARHLRSIDPKAGDLVSASGSTLDVTTTLGIATVCRSRRDTLFITLGSDSAAWSGVLPRNVSGTDAVRLWRDRSGTWISRGIKTVATSAVPCGEPFAPWPGAATQRLVLSDSAPDVRPGALVRIVERERWTLSLSGDGTWSLTLASWNPGTAAFAVAQPLLAPLAPASTPTGAGFTVRTRDAAGTLLTTGSLTAARAVDIVLRSAPHTRYGSITDSVRVDVGAP